MQVPSKYLGKEINALLAKINDPALENLSIPLTANIGGMYNSPQVSTDLTSGVKQLTAQLVEIEKQKLIAKGTDKAKSLIGGLLGGNNADTEDSTKTEDPLKKGAKEVLGGLLGGTKKTDSTTAITDTVPPKKEDAVKDAAKDILGGLFGKKKKPEAKKDTVN